MSKSAADIFAGVQDAPPKRGANYLRPGHYFCFIRAIRMDENRKKEPFVAVEMTILHVLQKATDESDRVVSNKVGEDASQLLFTKFEMFLSNIKSMVSGITGCSEDDVDEATCVEMVSDQQPCANFVVEVRATNIVTKADKDFTDVVYEGLVSTEDLEKAGVDIKENWITADMVPDAEDDGDEG